MTTPENLEGACLCGAVSIRVVSTEGHVHACHCDTCRRWGGGPALSFNAGTGVEISGGENITEFDSSEWARRGFCNKCGTHVYYQLKETGEFFLSTGTFDDESGFELDSQLFIDRKPGFYHFGNDTKNLTAEEVYALFESS